MSSARDRRAPLFGGAAPSSAVDPESLEIENDREIAALGERVGLLKSVGGAVTGGIHAEVEQHHAILDRMSQSMGGIQLGLGGAANKFKQVMNGPQGRTYIAYGCGAAVVLFFIYLWLR